MPVLPNSRRGGVQEFEECIIFSTEEKVHRVIDLPLAAILHLTMFPNPPKYARHAFRMAQERHFFRRNAEKKRAAHEKYWTKSPKQGQGFRLIIIGKGVDHDE